MDDMDDFYDGGVSHFHDDPSAAAAMTISDFRDEHGEDGYDDGYGRDDDDGVAFNVSENASYLEMAEMMAVGASENQSEVILPLESRRDVAEATDLAVGDSYLGPDSFAYEDMVDSAGEILTLKPSQTTDLVRKQARFSADTPQQTTKAKQPGPGGASVDKFITGAARRTRPIMTKFEYAAIIGERATQIEAGAQNIDKRVVARARSEGIDSALDIAELELETLEADFPLTVQRRIGPNMYEVWNVRELLLPSQILCSSYSPEATRLLLGSRGDHCPHDVSKALTNSYKRFVLAENTA